MFGRRTDEHMFGRRTDQHLFGRRTDVKHPRPGSFGPNGHRIDFCEGTVQLIVIGTLLHRPSPLPLGIPGGYSDKKKNLPSLKFLRKDWGNTCVTSLDYDDIQSQ
jgi:hypothetical protein